MKIFNFQILVLLLFVSTIQANDFRYRGFSGGMMVNFGYHQSDNFTVYNSTKQIVGNHRIEGFTQGLGGLARFHFGNKENHIRIGGEGFASDINYGTSASYEAISWGGMIIDYQRQGAKVLPFVGVVIGGGSVKNHYFPAGNSNNFQMNGEAMLRNYTFMSLSPFIGIEFSITQKLRFIAKADYMLNITNPQPDYATGIRGFLGIVFHRPN